MSATLWLQCESMSHNCPNPTVLSHSDLPRFKRRDHKFAINLTHRSHDSEWRRGIIASDHDSFHLTDFVQELIKRL